MTKKRPSFSVRYVFWFVLKLLLSLSVVLCFFALLKLNSQSRQQFSIAYARSSLSLDEHFVGIPKIAFLFLARKDLPLDFVWWGFFENADALNFSIYVHSEPGFLFDESTTRSPLFYGRQLSKSVKVMWGESSMIEAERLLLGAALRDPANQRFVLLSDSCVPLYNFSYMYNYVMASPRSFVDSFVDTHEGRYNPKMSPVIPKDKWRKGSQWITLVRKDARVIVDDDIIFPVFKRFCKRRPPVDPRKIKQNPKIQKQHNCIPDEHYVQTLLSMNELEGDVERRTLTYTLWNQSTTDMEGNAWHPMTFNYSNACPQQIREIKEINHVYYETEYRTEWCQTNSTFVPCFLFARKFSRGAAMRILTQGLVGSFDATAMLNVTL
ncbi:glycosyltransferase BC10-like [Macadamia integrifolia]|uniref:glycosyltransferase BC10-like n=1 Tax=Macadamia integrifolia TaxID=60698 RepID=UPI001C52BA0C|nr:glycosyltransferase BC10-like [Macadamia integrifolia]XP_042519617.1 glycosyltransferase BC10-like [Macadamia integrifolia]XP_042519618.1 glycosyltransferase BC10-like [Macadamia integrifolia]